MPVKILKQVVRAAVVKEQWRRIPKPAQSGNNYRCTGEVKNVGHSEIRDLLVIGAVYNVRHSALVQVRDRRWQQVKTVGYTRIKKLAPDESANFDVTIDIPDYNEILWGRKDIRQLERRIQNGQYRHKIFLVYDTKRLDERTRKWFKNEGTRRVSITDKDFKLEDDPNKGRAISIFKGRLYNAGTADLEDFDVITSIAPTDTGVPLEWRVTKNRRTGKPLPKDKHRVYITRGHKTIANLAARKHCDVEVMYYLPPDQVLQDSPWTVEKIVRDLESGALQNMIELDFERNIDGPSIYRDFFEDPALIEEVSGTRKLDLEKERWEMETDGATMNRKYVCRGDIVNSGSLDVENIYIICSIQDSENNEVLTWDTGVDMVRALEIENVPFSQPGERTSFEVHLTIPKKMRWKGKNLTEGEIVRNVETDNFKHKVEIYYKQEDVYEEGIKRLNLGNAYFRLGNHVACIKEYIDGMKLMPDSEHLQCNLTLAYYKSGKFADALDVVLILLEQKPEYMQAHYLCGLALLKISRYLEAAAHFLQVQEMEENSVPVCYNMACCYFLAEHEAEGYEWLDKALALDRPRVIHQAMHDKQLESLRKNEDFISHLTTVR